MIVKKGDRGKHVRQIQRALRSQGFWPLTITTLYFGKVTDAAVRKFQKDNGLVVDGKVGSKTLKLLDISISVRPKYDETYKGVTIKGSVFDGSPVRDNLKITLNTEMVNKYLPIMSIVMKDQPKGFKLLCTIMTYKEGFRVGTRSYKNNNPGNIGNTDSGKNVYYQTLKAGINKQMNYIIRVANGNHPAYLLGSDIVKKPYFSPEIARHTKLYGISPYVPGYMFTFTGQLDQFVKIYATGPRASNTYLSMIVSFYKANGITITAQSKIQDIIKIK